MPTDESYDRARHDFEQLGIEERARFLIEASVSTLARGLEEAGQVLADGLEDVMHRSRRSSRAPGASGPGAAEPETAQRRAPKTGHSTE